MEKQKKVLAVIPARYASTRFPGKVIQKIGSLPMIQYVYEAVRSAKMVDQIIIATEDERVREVVKGFGAECIITSEEHKSGTDRVAEVANLFPEYEIVVNVQGDEPGIEPSLIDGVILEKLQHPEWEVATAVRPFKENEDPLQPNRVKAVITKKRRALYFSRSLIPFPRNNLHHTVYLHLGIYAYDRDFLLHFTTLPRSVFEEVESLEQLRVLENDYNIGVYITDDSLPGVDTPEDLKLITEIFRKSNKLK
ncbi:MAG: 3-deoxy-manno-octulosonate cytidylyltransferase [Leptospiraceae bacterium]|nr:3-deoxy-manno-octulosonate cytidylyltransferase [Leptospiraceae bacterium]MDW7976831.1 3-deoxy-manno-octulosonate cytidylyltransferase [Leptospiraceae bacterium]